MLVCDSSGTYELSSTGAFSGSPTLQTTLTSGGSSPTAFSIVCVTPTTVNGTGTNISVNSGTSTGTRSAGYILFQAGNAPGTGTGGGIFLACGNSQAGRGGDFTLNTVNAVTGATRAGNLSINSGFNSDAGPGGDVTITAGYGYTRGGRVIITAGDGNNTSGADVGGDIIISAGGAPSGADAGDITLNTGSASGAGSSGKFQVFIGSNTAASALSILPLSASSDDAKIGFFGATPVAKPTGVAVTAAAIHAALVSLGLIAA
jgi:hypothetical protein